MRTDVAGTAHPTVVVRPRGWHLPEHNLAVAGKSAVGALVDFGLHFFHNAGYLAERGAGPFYYLPKMESHLEARLWNDVFTLRADAAHPDLVPVCREIFDRVLGDKANQLDRAREEVSVTAEQLLDVAATPGAATEADLRAAVDVVLDPAAELFEQVALATEFPDFLTLPAYEHIR